MANVGATRLLEDNSSNVSRRDHIAIVTRHGGRILSRISAVNAVDKRLLRCRSLIFAQMLLYAPPNLDLGMAGALHVR